MQDSRRSIAMAVRTKEELLAELEIAYIDFASRATKAEIQGLLDFFAHPREGAAGPVTKISLLDRSGKRTVINLADHTLEVPSMYLTQEDGVVTGGTPSTEVVIDLTSMLLFNNDAIWFDPHPEIFPIGVTYEEAPSEAAT
jgi:hypothetical protein